MAAKKNMSIEDILKACRSTDGGEESAAAGAPEGASESAASPEPRAEKPATEKPAAKAPGKAPGEMSVADILAAARSDASSGGDSETTSEASAPAPKADKPAKKAGEMSVADILAAARGDGPAAAKKPAAAPKAKAKPKAAAKAGAAGKASPKAPAAPLDTSSILAAARKGTEKRGPMSKAEAAAKGKDLPGKKKAAAPPMPEKPAYAVAKPKAKPADDDRRGFFSVFLGSFLALGFTSLSLTGLLSTLGLARYFFPNILIEPPSKFKVGFPTTFAPGSVETKFKAQFGVWIVNAAYEGQQQIVALKTVCTHLGCTPNWLEAEQKFKCPCHGSGFYKDGINFEGPAPRPLERYAIQVADDGQLEIDKSKTFQQEMGQWSDSSCYVPV